MLLKRCKNYELQSIEANESFRAIVGIFINVIFSTIGSFLLHILGSWWLQNVGTWGV